MIAASPQLTVTPTAEQFVQEQHAENVLVRLAGLTAEVFPGARHLSADLDGSGTRWVRIRVEVPWPDGERTRRARDEWYARTAAAFPPTVLAHFGLEIDRRPEQTGFPNRSYPATMRT